MYYSLLRSDMSRTGVTFLRGMIALIVGLMFMSVNSASAQIPSDFGRTGGTLYYLAFPDTVTNAFDSRFPGSNYGSSNYSVFVYSPVSQTVRITGVGGGTTNVQIKSDEILEFDAADIGVPQVTKVNAPQTNVVKIQAEYPVVVYGYMGTVFGSGAYTALPVESWGTEYIAATWPGEVVRNVYPVQPQDGAFRAEPKEAPAQILIIAAFDDTRVTIQSTSPLRQCAGCNTVSLNSGEAYLVQSIVDIEADEQTPQNDLAGTRIISSKVIGVVSGNTRMTHRPYDRPGLARNSFKDLVMEWITPTDMHGTEFVFTPTLDGQHVDGGGSYDVARDFEFVRIFGTSDEETAVSRIEGDGSSRELTGSPVANREFVQDDIEDTVARAYVASYPAYAVMSPAGLSQFDGLLSSERSAVFHAWSTFMSELVPRERWTSMAPVISADWPASGAEHFLSVVTDKSSAQEIFMRNLRTTSVTRFEFFPEEIPGTELIWGIMPLPQGTPFLVFGMDGARFTGQVFGLWEGGEAYREYLTEKKNESEIAASSSLEGAPAEYEEDVALSYGYPLASRNCVPADPVDYRIDAKYDCSVFAIDIDAAENNAAGIASIRLIPDSTSNARIVFVEPDSPLDFAGRRINEAHVQVVPIDPARDAHAVVEIVDRYCSSAPRLITFDREAPNIALSPSNGLDFGFVDIDRPSPEKVVELINHGTNDLTIRSLGLVFGNQEFVITRTEPEFDWGSGTDNVVLGTDQTFRVWLRITPKDRNRLYIDTLRIGSGCGDLAKLQIRAETAMPCIRVEDLDFGQLLPGVSKSLPLTICNQGTGTVTFSDPYLTWLATQFSVDSIELQKLREVELGADECVTVIVSFSSGVPGVFRTTARFWANTRDCRDTSIWRANVVDTLSGIRYGHDPSGSIAATVEPNPTNGTALIGFSLVHPEHVTVEIFDGAGRHVQTVLQEQREAGRHEIRWDGSPYPAGVYMVRISSDSAGANLPILLVR